MASLTIGSSALNEEEALERVVTQWLEVVPTLTDDFEILLVDDGSTDRTGAIMDELAAREPSVRVIHHPYNLGFRGFANTLAKNATKELFAGVSCDGEVPIEALGPMMDRIAAGADVVVGNRRQLRGYSAYRRFVSRSYNTLVRSIFGSDFRDIGALKLYRTEVLRAVEPIISKSAFMNAERLIKAERLGYRIELMPIDHLPRLGGVARGASYRWVRDAAVDLVRVTWHLHTGGWRPSSTGRR